MTESFPISFKQWKVQLRQIRTSGLIRHTSTYFVSALVVQAIGFVSLPVLTRLLTVNEFGTLDVWRGYISLLFAALTLNSYTAIGRYYYENSDDLTEFFGTLFILVLSLTVLSAIAAGLFPTQLAHFLGLPSEVMPYIAPVVLFTTFASWFEQIYIPQKKSRQIAIRNIINAIALLGLAIFFIRMLPTQKYMGYLYAQVITGILFSIYYFQQLKRYLTPCFRWKHLKYIGMYSLPLLPYSLGGVLLNYFDRIMINRYFGAKSAGLYGFAYNVGMLLPAFVGAVSRAWMPDYFSLMDNKDYTSLNRGAVRIFYLICSAALFLIFFSKEIGMILVPDRYYDSLNIIPAIIIGYIFSAIYGFYGWSFDYSKKTVFISLITVLCSLLNAVLNMWLLPVYGYKAAAYTTLASYAVMAIMAWVLSRSAVSTHTIPFTPLLRVLLYLTPFYLAFEGIQRLSLHLGLEILIKILLFMVFALFAFKNVQRKAQT